MRTLVCFSLILFLTGCAPVTVNTLLERENAQLLNAQELYSLINGNTLSIRNAGEDISLYFQESGHIAAKDIQANQDTGKWDVSVDGELCFRMRKWWHGDLRCYTLYRAENTYHLANASAVLVYTAKAFSGDSQRLHRTEKAGKRSYRNALQATRETTTQEETAAPGLDEQASKKAEQHHTDNKQDIHNTVKWIAKNCPGCNLEGANLSRADLIEANLKGAQLYAADLSHSNLRRANLQGADLRNADLRVANLPGANLQDADLRGANLQGANLIRANVTGAQIDKTSFDGALLDAIIGFPH